MRYVARTEHENALGICIPIEDEPDEGMKRGLIVLNRVQKFLDKTRPKGNLWAHIEPYGKDTESPRGFRLSVYSPGKKYDDRIYCGSWNAKRIMRKPARLLATGIIGDINIMLQGKSYE